MRVLVTGAGGFVGRHLCRELVRKDAMVRGVSRREDATLERGVELAVVRDFADRSALKEALVGVTAVVHLAARVHVMHETASDATGAFREANVEATRVLCEMARLAGVSCFVYLSSVKVHGEGSDIAYSESDPPDPRDAYARSKREAETVVSEVLGGAVGWACLRPPLIYGPGVRGNFRRLLRVASYARWVPLPLGRIDNRRSLLYVGNLVDAIIRCLESPTGQDRALLVSDGEDLSTSELIQRLASEFGGGLPLAPCPVGLARGALRSLGRGEEADRLFGSYIIDSSAIRRELGWTPPFSVDEGLAHTVRWFETYSGGRFQS